MKKFGLWFMFYCYCIRPSQEFLIEERLPICSDLAKNKSLNFVGCESQPYTDWNEVRLRNI